MATIKAQASPFSYATKFIMGYEDIYAADFNIGAQTYSIYKYPGGLQEGYLDKAELLQTGQHGGSDTYTVLHDFCVVDGDIITLHKNIASSAPAGHTIKKNGATVYNLPGSGTVRTEIWAVTASRTKIFLHTHKYQGTFEDPITDAESIRVITHSGLIVDEWPLEVYSEDAPMVWDVQPGFNYGNGFLYLTRAKYGYVFPNGTQPNTTMIYSDTGAYQGESNYTLQWSMSTFYRGNGVSKNLFVEHYGLQQGQIVMQTLPDYQLMGSAITDIQNSTPADYNFTGQLAVTRDHIYTAARRNNGSGTRFVAATRYTVNDIPPTPENPNPDPSKQIVLSNTSYQVLDGGKFRLIRADRGPLTPE